MKLKFIAPCHFGLESVLKFEVGRIGASDINVMDGRVIFSGDLNTLAKANLRLRTAERVGILLSSFKATDFDKLFDEVYQIPFENFIGKYDQFPNKGYSINSQLHSIPAIQSIVKKAMARRLGEKYGVQVLEETGSVCQIQFAIIKDEVNIILDTSGEGLHKRGYRRRAGGAPIKETLAAGIIDIARVREGDIVCDPFCGSSTLLIEAAYKALNIAPGLSRHFSAQSHGYMDNNIWREEKALALSEIKRDAEFQAYGYDIDQEMIDLSILNSRKAGVIKRIFFQQRDIADFSYIDEPMKIIANPPYGERLLEVESARELYKKMGEKLLPRNANSIYIITPDSEFESIFGQKSDKNRKLYNGMIMCRLHSYFSQKPKD